MTRTALYRFFDPDDVLLYVGTTDDVETRWGQHANMKAWWPDVARKTVTWYDVRETAEGEERLAIREETPLHNVQHAPGRNPVTRVSWWNYVMEISANASHSEIARKVGVSQPSVTQWRKSAPKAASVRAFATAYDVPVIRAYIAAGYLTEDEAREICD